MKPVVYTPTGRRPVKSLRRSACRFGGRRGAEASEHGELTRELQRSRASTAVTDQRGVMHGVPRGSRPTTHRRPAPPLNERNIAATGNVFGSNPLSAAYHFT